MILSPVFRAPLQSTFYFIFIKIITDSSILIYSFIHSPLQYTFYFQLTPVLCEMDHSKIGLVWELPIISGNSTCIFGLLEQSFCINLCDLFCFQFCVTSWEICLIRSTKNNTVYNKVQFRWLQMYWMFYIVLEYNIIYITKFSGEIFLVE